MQPETTARSAGVAALVALAVTDFLVMLDGLLVTVILPDIQRELGFSQADLGWVVTGYVLVFAGCMLLAGRIADLYGRRLLLLIGYALFGVGALLGGLADSAWMLIASRAIQGLGAAAMTPAGLSLLTVAFPSGDRALGVWAAAGSIGIPSGALLGGLVAGAWGWRWVILINVPAAVIGGLLALRSLEESKLPRAQRHLDLPGAATVTGGLAALILALTQLEPMLRGAPTILGGAAGFVVPLAVGILLLAIFAAIESRTAHPLVSLRLLRVPGIVRANIAAAGLPVGLGAMMFIATQYLQAIRGLTPWETGLTYLALALPVTVFSPVAARLLGWLGRRRTAALGFALQATGLLLFLTVGPDSSLLGTVLPAFAITGAGAPIAYIPVTGAAVEDVGDDSGLASGLYNTTQQVSNTIALAAMAAAVAIGSSAAESGGVATSVTVDGVRAGFGAAAVLALGAAVASLFLRREGAVTASAVRETTEQGREPELARAEP
ncbi:MFS transporter [Verrucosispora sioxanthis]|uniref:MFS transporter n=1 Tax=Verrucosispora sioxanthis TaxID=2499994 RepID=UPI001C11F039|nr:MFS transporter [Verrucosispora sioxanthis]